MNKFILRSIIEKTKRILPLAVAFLMGLSTSWGQSNPTAQNLPFSVNFGTTTFTTMPTGTAAWNGLSGATVITQALAESSAPGGNATLSAATGSQTTGGTYGYNATSTTNAALYIQTSSNTSNGCNQFAVSINTGVGVTSVVVGYDVRVISSNTCTMGLVLQYRAGTTGSWTTISGSAVTYNNTPTTNGGDSDTNGDSDSYSYTVTGLSASTAYQFRWATWKTTSCTSTGLGIDNVSITASAAKTNPTLSISNTPTNYTGSSVAATVAGSVAGVVSNVKYGGSATVPTNAGTYAITANFVPTDTAAYNSLTDASAGNFVISPIAPTLSVGNTPQNYTGSAIAATVSGTGGGTVSNIKYAGSATVPINAGTYAITADITATTNYSAATGASAGNFVINKVAPTLSVGNTPQNYSGSSIAATVSGTGGGTVTNIKYGGSATVPTNAGTYAITADIATSTNYSAATGASAGNFVINKIAPTLSVTNSPQSFTGSPIAATVTGTGGGTVTNVLYDGSSTVPTSAGTYAITADIAASTNYNAAAGASAGSFVITSKLTPTLSVTNSPVTYNGSAIAATVSGSVAGTVSNIKYNGSATVPTTAGTYAITANLIPDDQSTYSDLTDAAAGNFVINKATPSLSISNSPQNYTGASIAATVVGSVAGVVSNRKYDGSLTAPTNVNTYAVTANFVPTDGTNYNSLTDASAGNFVINKATPSLSVTNSPQSYTGSPIAATVSGTGGGTVSNIQYNGSSTVPTNVGSYAITADIDASANYNAATGLAVGNFVVNKVTPTISGTLAATAITFGQTLASSSLSGATAVFGSIPVAGTYSFTTLSTAPNAGTASQGVTFTPSDTINYNTFTTTVSVTVNKATPTVSGTLAATSIILGQTLASSALSGATAVNGATSVAGTYAFTTPATQPVATGTASYSVTFTPTDTNNYNTFATTVSVTVLPVPVITATPASLAAFSTTSGTASTAQAIAVAGTNLIANITVTPPSGFEVSKTSATTGFSTSVTVTQSSGVASATVYVRLTSSASGTPSGNVALTSTSATTVNVAVSGTVSAAAVTGAIATWDVSGQSSYGTSPLIATSAASNVTVGGLTRGSGVTTTNTAASRAWGGNGWNTASAAAITGNQFFTYTVKANTNYALSLSSINPIDVRTSAANTTLLVQYQINSNSFVDITTSATIGSSSSGVSLSAIDLTGITALQNLPSTSTVTFRFIPILPSASTTSTFYIFDKGVSTASDFTLSGSVSSATSSIIAGGGPLAALSTSYGNASSATSFTVGGSNLTNTISIAALSGFEFNNPSVNSTYTDALTGISATGPTTINVRLKAGTNAGTYSGNIVCSSTGASSLNIPMSSSIVNKVTPTLTITSTNPVIFNGAAQTVTVAGTGGGTVSSILYAGSSTAPSNAGTYAITADIAASANYNAATGLSAGNFVIGDTTTYTTSWDFGAPTASLNAVINGTYSTTTNGTIAAKSLTVNATKSLTINSGTNVTVQNAVVNNGTLTIENNANLIQVNDATNTGSGTTTVKRNSNALYRLDYTMWSSPVSGQNLLSFSPLTSALASSIRFYQYNPLSDKYVTIDPQANSFLQGRGYLIRMPNEKPGSLGTTTAYYLGTETLAYPGVFTGTLNNGSVTVATSAGNYYSVGNPYPSTISADLFLSNNSTAGTLYFWRKKNGVSGSAYATYTYAGGTGTGDPKNTGITPNGTIQVGQGFLVKATTTSLSFTNGMRTSNNENQIFKTRKVADKSRVWLSLSDAKGGLNQAMVAYINGATLGVDAGYDGKYFNDSKVALTSTIDSEEYVIQARPTFDATDVVALAFKTDVAGDYTIALDSFDGVFESGQDVYLVDAVAGKEIDLKAGSYSFTATAGADNARFSLKYQKTLKVDAPAFNENSVKVYKNNGSIVVNSTAKAIKTIAVYDIQGRLIAQQKNVNATTATISNLKAVRQVLIVKVSADDNSVVTKKVLN